MTTDHGSEMSLQEKLQGQVASSVKEALEKSTSILSNVHHLSNFIAPGKMGGSIQRVKSAHEQIQTIRADCASLLQTMYLGEIGLQSLLDMLKTSSLMPHIFSDSLSSTPIAPSTNSSDHAETMFDDDSILGKHTLEHSLEEESAAKKSVVAVFICSGCNRKFAINSDPNQVPSHCRNCRNSVLSTDTTTIGTTEQQQLSSSSTPSTSSPVIKPAIAFASNPHKQLKPKGTRRGKFNQLICKLCGISFFYRRCLLRHLREQHAQAVDVNNLHGYDQYIEVASQSSQESCSDLQKEGIDVSVPSPQSPGLDMTGDSQLNSHSAEYALQDCDPSQFSYNDSDLSQADLSQSTAGDMSQGGANISQADLSQSSAVIHQHVGLNLGSSSISATSIIEAVQTQAMLEQASALLSQNNITDQSGGVDGDTSSLLTQINSSVNDENPDKQAAMATGNKLDDNGPFREFKCTVCNKSFDRPYRLTRHLEIHDPNRPRIPCNYCSKSFTRKDSLESHIKTIHASVYPFSCSHDGCNRSFATRSMYLNHLKVHGDNKPYHCQECSESFGHLAELKDHFKKEHPENDSLRCVECFKVFSTLEELEEHKLHDHRFECENCGKVFARLAYLQNHVRVHNGESKFNCRFCSEGFNSAYSYRQHMKNHPEYRRIINVFPCHPCGKTFEEPKDLVTHYETEEHKEKASNVENAVGPSTATSMMEGDLSVMGELMTDQIINSIVNTHHSGFEEMSSSQS